MKKCLTCKKYFSIPKGLENIKKFCSTECSTKYYNIHNKIKRQIIIKKCTRMRSLTRQNYFVNKYGGGCVCCGYNKNYAALEFHHVPEKGKKLFEVNMYSFSHRTMEALEIEAAKCVLICANCHREDQYPQQDRVNILKELAV